jgi:hypothetical protein
VPNAIAFRTPDAGILGTGWEGCTTGQFGCRPQGTISLTTNGGKTWRVVLRTPRPVVAVGYEGRTLTARYDDGENLASFDGGRRWTPVVAQPTMAGPCPPATTPYVVSDWALCTTQASAGSEGKSVYALGPGGWKRVASTPFAPPTGHAYGGISLYGYPQGIAMAPNGFGIIWESRGTLYVTRDGGSHWTGLPKVARPDIDFGMSAAVLSPGTGFVILADGGSTRRRLLETTDAGATWRTVSAWR